MRPRTAADLARYERFALNLPGQTTRRLLDHARDLLDTHDCQHEPLTWSPRVAAVDSRELPGSEPDAADPQLAHALLAQGIAPGDVSEQLAITLEHLRYLIRRHPRDNPRPESSDAPPHIRFAAHVTPDELRQLIDDGVTMTAIARRYDVARSTVRADLVANAIPVPPNHRPRHPITRDWLHQQYVVKHRTMPDIAVETGASPATIARLIHQHQIPARPRGGPSHQQSLTIPAGYPQPLSQAVLGQGGLDRVRRFQVYARTRSLNAAAKRLSIHQSTLTTQLSTLEHACAGQLLKRLTRDQQPPQLTTLGRALLAQADRHLGPNPNAPADLPEPLAAVLATHRGGEALATFAAATACTTLNDAAMALGVHPSSLHRTIRRVQDAAGAHLLTDYRRSSPLSLTATGDRLLQQARQHHPHQLQTASLTRGADDVNVRMPGDPQPSPRPATPS